MFAFRASTNLTLRDRTANKEIRRHIDKCVAIKGSTGVSTTGKRRGIYYREYQETRKRKEKVTLECHQRDRHIIVSLYRQTQSGKSQRDTACS